MRSEQLDAIFRRSLDQLPPLAEDDWVPRERGGATGFAGAPLALIVMLLVAVIGAAVLRIAREPERDGAAAATPTPRPLPTRDAQQPRVIGVPNLIRNETYGYNLVTPGWWRRVDALSQLDPAMPDLLGREVFTPYGAAEPAAPWSMAAEVWRARGQDPLPFARAHLPNAQDPTFDRTWASLQTSRVPHVQAIGALLAQDAGTRHRRAYYVPLPRGDYILVLSYTYDDAARAPDVTLAELESSVLKLGVVP
jgi:hypothetical protein